jgi:hypothetical protein
MTDRVRLAVDLDDEACGRDVDVGDPAEDHLLRSKADATTAQRRCEPLLRSSRRCPEEICQQRLVSGRNARSLLSLPSVIGQTGDGRACAARANLTYGAVVLLAAALDPAHTP